MARRLVVVRLEAGQHRLVTALAKQRGISVGEALALLVDTGHRRLKALAAYSKKH